MGGHIKIKDCVPNPTISPFDHNTICLSPEHTPFYRHWSDQALVSFYFLRRNFPAAAIHAHH